MARRSRVSARPSTRLRTLGRGRVFLWVNVTAALVLGGWYAVQTDERREEVRRLVGNAFAENKRVELVDVAWDLYQFYYGADFVAAPAVAGDRTILYAGMPAGGESLRLLRNSAYLVGYSEVAASPLWAAYRVTDVNPLPSAAERPDRFEVDTRTVARVSPEVYLGTGYDRGHLAPNYAIGTRHGEAAQRETFLMSNVIPQRHGLNAGLWKQLEMRIATDWPARFGEVWVLAGPVFGATETRLPSRSSGPGQGPRVPEGGYMVVVDESEGRVRALAFILPQESSAGASAGDFLTTIDEVERRTGLDLLSDLPDGVEAELEARRAERVW